MLDDLTPGAHLVTPRWGYQHHGIYVGGGRVIHYAGWHRFFRRGPVEEVTLDQFADSAALKVRAWPVPAFSGEATVKRARSRLGEDRYSLWSNNCEHLVEWCISGTSRSVQVDSRTKWLRDPFADFCSSLARPGSAAPRAN